MTPIFIVSFNRLTFLRKMVTRLLEMGQQRIIIVDNGSTYEPLLQYYEEIYKEIELLRMGRNYGYAVMKRIFRDPAFNRNYQLNQENFIYSDDDIVPIEECPSDFIEKFNAVLAKYNRAAKVGFGLKINDIPDSFKCKSNVVKVMETYCREEEKIHDDQIGIDLYPVPIDTTLACGRAGVEPGWTMHALRMGFPYLARHLPWYINSESLSEEDQYYMKVAGIKDTHFPHRWGLEHMLKGVNRYD
jgi:hypothetical protein